MTEGWGAALEVTRETPGIIAAGTLGDEMCLSVVMSVIVWI